MACSNDSAIVHKAEMPAKHDAEKLLPRKSQKVQTKGGVVKGVGGTGEKGQ